MSPHKKTNKKHSVTENDNTGWDAMIISAVKQLQAMEAMTAKIRFSLNYFEDRKLKGEAFPGIEKLKAADLVHDIS